MNSTERRIQPLNSQIEFNVNSIQRQIELLKGNYTQKILWLKSIVIE